MKVADLLSILNIDEKEELYKILKKDHEKRIEEESKKGYEVIKVKDHDFKYDFIDNENSTIGYINTKAFDIDEIFDFFHKHKYSNNITIVPSDNKKSINYLINVFRNMNFKVKSRDNNLILLERKKL